MYLRLGSCATIDSSGNLHVSTCASWMPRTGTVSCYIPSVQGPGSGNPSPAIRCETIWRVQLVQLTRLVALWNRNQPKSHTERTVAREYSAGLSFSEVSELVLVPRRRPNTLAVPTSEAAPTIASCVGQTLSNSSLHRLAYLSETSGKSYCEAVRLGAQLWGSLKQGLEVP